MAIDGDIEAVTQQVGRRLLADLRGRSPHRPMDWVADQLLAFMTAHDRLKVELFRFVDTLPALNTPAAVTRHLREYLDQPGVELPLGAQWWLHGLSRFQFADRQLARLSQWGAKKMARRFIAGANADEATAVILRMRQQNLGSTLDLLGEFVTSPADASRYQQQYLDLIREMSAKAAKWRPLPRLERSPFGPIPRVNVSVKLSALYAGFDPLAADHTAEAVKQRLRPILTLARQTGAFINFDMEQHDYRSITRRIFDEVLMEDAYHDWPDVGVVVQAYLRDSADDLSRLIDWATRRGTPVWVRLVKGAYWDYETILAAQRGLPSPVFDHKHETDANYEALTRTLFANWRTLRPAIATHNVRSAAHALATAASLKLPPGAVEFQVLLGMGEPIARALSRRGQRVRVYTPFGQLLPGMAYLVRRLLENTSNDSFVRHLGGHDSTADLLATPVGRDSNPAGGVARNGGIAIPPYSAAGSALADQAETARQGGPYILPSDALPLPAGEREQDRSRNDSSLSIAFHFPQRAGDGFFARTQPAGDALRRRGGRRDVGEDRADRDQRAE